MMAVQLPEAPSASSMSMTISTAFVLYFYPSRCYHELCILSRCCSFPKIGQCNFDFLNLESLLARKTWRERNRRGWPENCCRELRLALVDVQRQLGLAMANTLRGTCWMYVYSILKESISLLTIHAATIRWKTSWPSISLSSGQILSMTEDLYPSTSSHISPSSPHPPSSRPDPPQKPRRNSQTEETKELDTIHKLIKNPVLYDPLRVPRNPIVLCHGMVYAFNLSHGV